MEHASESAEGASPRGVKVDNFTPFPLVATSRLRRHPQNPNYHPKAQIDALCEVVLENGWRSPVVVSKRSGLVIKGHGRIEAAERLGVAVPVEYQDYADEAVEVRDLIADNKIQELSQLDNKTVNELVAKFKIKAGAGFVRMNTGVLAKTLASVAEKKPKRLKFPILILENEEQYQMFERLKETYGAKTDAALFAQILKAAFIRECGDEVTGEIDDDTED